MSKAIPFDEAPSDAARLEVEIDRMLRELELSARRMDEAEREFDRGSAEIDAMLRMLKRSLQIQ